jgi:hypothetical protein
MLTVWVYRFFLLVAVPSLLLLGSLVATSLPPAIEARNEDLPGLVAWAVAVAVGVLLTLAAIVLRWRGKPGMAAALVGIVAMPALCGIGLALFVLMLFILKPG